MGLKCTATVGVKITDMFTKQNALGSRVPQQEIQLFVHIATNDL